MENGVLAQSTTSSPGEVVSSANPMYMEDASRFSSTNAEGLGRGLGAFADGIGKLNLYNSMAAANFEEARRRAIDNHRRAVENTFALRQINEQYRESQLRHRASTIATLQTSKPAVHATSPIDPITGAIQWPEPLMANAYSAFRDQLERQFSQPTAGQVDTGQQQVQDATRAMQQQLKTRIRQMSPSDYVTAKKFIDGLAQAYESQLARQSDALGVR
jgi:hypothetical protein